MLKRYCNIKWYWLVAMNLAIYYVALFIEFKYIFTDNFYATCQMNEEDILLLMTQDRAVEWVNFVLLPITIAIFVFSLGFVLFIIKNLKNQVITFGYCFKICLLSYIVFPLNYFLTVIFKFLGIIGYNYENVNDIYRYQSILKFFDVSTVPSWAVYTLEKINICELLFFLFYFLILKIYLGYSYFKALKTGLLSYGIWLLISIIIQNFLVLIFDK